MADRITAIHPWGQLLDEVLHQKSFSVGEIGGCSVGGYLSRFCSRAFLGVASNEETVFTSTPSQAATAFVSPREIRQGSWRVMILDDGRYAAGVGGNVAQTSAVLALLASLLWRLPRFDGWQRRQSCWRVQHREIRHIVDVHSGSVTCRRTSPIKRALWRVYGNRDWWDWRQQRIRFWQGTLTEHDCLITRCIGLATLDEISGAILYTRSIINNESICLFC